MVHWQRPWQLTFCAIVTCGMVALLKRTSNFGNRLYYFATLVRSS